MLPNVAEAAHNGMHHVGLCRTRWEPLSHVCFGCCGTRRILPVDVLNSVSTREIYETNNVQRGLYSAHRPSILLFIVVHLSIDNSSVAPVVVTTAEV